MSPTLNHRRTETPPQVSFLIIIIIIIIIIIPRQGLIRGVLVIIHLESEEQLMFIVMCRSGTLLTPRSKKAATTGTANEQPRMLKLPTKCVHEDKIEKNLRL